MNAPSQLAYLQHVRDALRAVLEYTAGVDLEVVWRVVEVEVPSLLIVVEKLIEDLGRG